MQRVQRRQLQWRFMPQRADYYDYLATLLAGARGFFTLKDVFLQDAQRYGKQALRGRVAALWMHRYQIAGGDLYATWTGWFPADELALIRAAQMLGNEALVATLAHLGKVARLSQQAFKLLQAVLWPAGLALFVVVSLSLLVPWFTLPQLLHTFAMVPEMYFGVMTQRLLGFAHWIDRYYLPGFGVIGVGVTAILWSLPNMTGPVRRYLDRLLWWEMYRSVHALRFTMFLRVALGTPEQAHTRLRAAFLMQVPGANRWLRAHLDTMLQRLAQGQAGVECLDTGLFRPDHFWFLSDMTQARGLPIALELMAERLQHYVLETVRRRALILRWVMLLACVAYGLLLVLWHYVVIDELRQAMALVFSLP